MIRVVDFFTYTALYSEPCTHSVKIVGQQNVHLKTNKFSTYSVAQKQTEKLRKKL